MATALSPALEGVALAGALGFAGAEGFGFSGMGLCGGVCETPELKTRVCKGPNFWDSG